MTFFSSPRLVYLTMFILAFLAFPSDAALRIYGMRGKGLKGDFGSPPDAYVEVYVRDGFVGQTSVIQGSSNPTWSTNLFSTTAKVNDELKLQVWDRDLQNDDLLGTCYAQVTSGIRSFGCALSKGGTLNFSTEL